MSKKIQNILLKGMKVGISTEVVEFDADGIGTIQSDAVYEEIIRLANFSPVREAISTTAPAKATIVDTPVVPKVEPVVSADTAPTDTKTSDK